jgi:hypothetical protein
MKSSCLPLARKFWFNVKDSGVWPVETTLGDGNPSSEKRICLNTLKLFSLINFASAQRQAPQMPVSSWKGFARLAASVPIEVFDDLNPHRSLAGQLFVVRNPPMIKTTRHINSTRPSPLPPMMGPPK